MDTKDFVWAWRGGQPAVAINGQRENETVVVVDMLANKVDATWSAEDNFWFASEERGEG